MIENISMLSPSDFVKTVLPKGYEVLSGCTNPSEIVGWCNNVMGLTLADAFKYARGLEIAICTLIVCVGVSEWLHYRKQKYLREKVKSLTLAVACVNAKYDALAGEFVKRGGDGV